MIEKNLRSQLLAELGARADLLRLTPIEEPYFAALAKALGEMPAERKDAAIQEVRAHLWAMVEAKRVDGMNEEAAWQAAFKEFGEPEAVGHELWLQCVRAGRVEVEGEALSWPKTIGIRSIVIAITTVYCVDALTHKFAPAKLGENLLYVIFLLNVFGQSPSAVKGKLLLSSKVDFVASLVFIFSMLTSNLWRDTIFAPIRDYSLIASAIFYFVASILSWKRELALRPWQWDRKYGINPVAAEQRYRFWPVLLLLIASAIACSLTLPASLALFSLPLALLVGLAPLGGAFFVGRWLSR